MDLELLAAQTIQDIRDKCRKDPIYLAAVVLGKDYFENPADFHRQAAQALIDQVDCIFLAPRNHAKTTIFDEVGTIFDLIRNPNTRILLACSTLSNAALLLRQITWHFIHNQKFRTVFPEYAVNERDEEGNRSSFNVPCRTANFKEASIEITGQDTAITGRHYDIIRCSDLVVRENVPPSASKEQMLRTIEWFRTTSSLLDTTNPKARRLIDGTRWHDGDLYGELLKNSAYSHFRRIVIAIAEHPPVQIASLSDISGVTTLPGDPIPVWDRMGVETLKRLRGEAGRYLWASNYKNDPLPADEAASFKREWFKFYDKAPSGLDIAITVDLAISDKEQSDRTAIVVSGIDYTGNLYVLGCHVGRWTPYDTVNRLFLLQAVWNPVYIGIESVAWQKAMIFILDEEGKKRGVRLPIKPLLPVARKEARAFPLATHAERYGIYVKPEHTELVDEFIRFPVGQHDDIVDALAYRAQDLFIPTQRLQEDIKQITAVMNYKMTGEKLLELVDMNESDYSVVSYED